MVDPAYAASPVADPWLDLVQAKKARARRRIGTVLAAALVTVLALVASQGTFNPDPNPGQTVAASLRQTLAAGSAAAQVSADVQSGAQEFSLTGTGRMDFAHGTVSIDETVHLPTQDQSVSVTYVGGAIFEALPDLDQVEPGKTWVALDFSVEADRSNLLFGGDNPAAMLALLAQPGVKVSSLGSQTIDGSSTDGYQVAIPQSAITHQLASPQIPPWLNAAFAHINFTDISETLHIDQSNRIRQFGFQMTVAGASTSMSYSETVDLSHFGLPVSISAPPAGETVSYDKLLRDVQALSNPQ
ncbi:MAG: hypothetical protein KGQ66_23420 [Acidobacteriota bacterium]|nr:hypothetical protein [Acidobacteriota bacterium]